ncbi:MAG TPA: hypothetical protein VEQ11_13290 [Chloroflexota bacterium]|nr:hypothetical protein [Chloroflexota bacterium]
MNLRFTDDERALLADLLDRAFRELKEENNKTEAYDYKETLKTRERTLVRLIDKVGQSAPA